MSEEIRTNASENPLGYEKISRLLIKFAIPSIIAMVVSSLYNVVDQIFIGQGVGYVGNAATNVAFPLTTVCIAIMLTIGIGSATRYSLALGRQDAEEAALVVGSGIVLMAVFGILYGLFVEFFASPILRSFGASEDVFGYALIYTKITAIGMPFVIVTTGLSHLARADGSPTFSMTTMLIGAILNTILDPIFIFVLHLGVQGAAIATVISQFVSLVAVLTYLGKFKRIVLKREHFVFSFKQLALTCKMGMSQGLTQLAITVIQIIMNRSLIYYGAMTEYGSSIPLAGVGVVMKVNAIIFSVLIGLSQSMQPIVGFNYGAKNYSRVKQTFKQVVLVELIVSFLALSVFEFFPRQVLSVFGTGDELYTKFSVYFMRVFLIGLPLGGVQMLSSNLFAAIGKAVKGAVLSLTRQVLIFIPIVLILPLFLGFDGVLFAGPISDFASFALALVFVAKEFKELK